MEHIRGFAIEPRGLGVTKLFNDNDFCVETLRQVDGRPADSSKPRQTSSRRKRIFRYPCSGCRTLLPIYGVKAGGLLPTEYDMDMDEADLEP